MNERIRELAKQAGFETNRVICSFDNYKAGNEYFFAEDFIEDELAKFAELIVRECADIATINSHQQYSAGHYVLKHFGVE